MQTLSPEAQYVPWQVFEWIMGILIAWGGAHSLLLLRLVGFKAILQGHTKELADHRADDNKAFAEVNARIDREYRELNEKLTREHLENKAAQATMEANLVRGQAMIIEEVHGFQHFFHEFLLGQFGRDKVRDDRGGK